MPSSPDIIEAIQQDKLSSQFWDFDTRMCYGDPPNYIKK